MPTFNLTPDSLPTIQGAMAGAAQGLPTTEDGLYSAAVCNIAGGGQVQINIPVTPAQGQS
jgi:hypothetical protein